MKKSPKNVEIGPLATLRLMGGQGPNTQDPTVNPGDKVIQVALSNIDTALQLGPR